MRSDDWVDELAEIISAEKETIIADDITARHAGDIATLGDALMDETQTVYTTSFRNIFLIQRVRFAIASPLFSHPNILTGWDQSFLRDIANALEWNPSRQLTDRQLAWADQVLSTLENAARELNPPNQQTN